MDAWSERDLAVLAALAETFVPGDAEHRARLAGDALLASTDPAQVRQLRLVLRLMDWCSPRPDADATGAEGARLSSSGRDRR